MKHKITTSLEHKLYRRLDAYSAKMNQTKTSIVEAAVQQYLDGLGDKDVLFRRIDSLTRRVDKTSFNTQIISEALAVYIEIWLAHTPRIPQDRRRAASAQAKERFEQLLTIVHRKLSNSEGTLMPPPTEQEQDIGNE